MVSVLTRSYDNYRTGSQGGETVLTPASIKNGLRKLFSLPIYGDKRGTEAQPLIVTNVRQSDGSFRNVVYLCSMANTVWAYDADDGTLLWVQRLGNPVKGDRSIDGWMINDQWGILGTPVIDAFTGTLYCVAWTSPDGTPPKARHALYALNLTTGMPVGEPLAFEGVTYDPGNDLPVQRFQSAMRKQRPGLTLTRKSISGIEHVTIFAAFGTVFETANTARGWIIACEVAPTFRITAGWTATSRYSGAGIWQAGQGLTADERGDLYAMTGNGAFDGITEFGECFIKLVYTPPVNNDQMGKLACVDWWSPFTDAGRVGQDETAEVIGPPTPTNIRDYTQMLKGGYNDMDLGSGAPVVVPALGLVLGAGKDGILYVMDRMRMGKTKPADFANAAANFAKLKSPPIWFTYFPGFDKNPAPQEATDLNFLFNQMTHHQHGSPIFWNSAKYGPMLFCWGENGNLRAWKVEANGKVSYLAASAEVASPNAKVPPGGMPGAMMCLTYNGAAASPGTGILWACVPLTDANTSISRGIVYAYDAEEFDTFPDGGAKLRLLWASDRIANNVFNHNKFNLPVVANGKLYVPTYDARIDVYSV